MENLKKILIVDDEQDILEFLSYNFKKKNFKVYTAANGKEGLAQAILCQPDIILSDILMPEMDGVKMCFRIREISQFKNTPVIFLTAVNDDYKVLHAMSSGADQIANKPIRFEYLLTMVNEMLEEKSLA
ncbi:MAG: response regulator [Bacteroidota bacterium]|nr:response regulator [Bacteroidota bacterium]